MSSPRCRRRGYVSPCRTLRPTRSPPLRGAGHVGGLSISHFRLPDRLHSASRSCRGTAPPGARRNALVTGVASAPGGAAPSRATRSLRSGSITLLDRCLSVATGGNEVGHCGSLSRSVGRRVAADGAAPPAAQAPLPSQVLLAPRTGGAVGGQDPSSEAKAIAWAGETRQHTARLIYLKAFYRSGISNGTPT
jgi:hypothetical protein